MQIDRKTVRAAAAAFASAVVGILVLTPIGEFVVAYLQEKGFYEHPSATVARLIGFFAAVVSSNWFPWVAGASVGFLIGIWFDHLLRLRATRVLPVATIAPPMQKGFFDYKVDMEEMVGQMTAITKRITKYQGWITSEIQKATARLQRLQRSGASSAKEARRITNALASKQDQFTSRVERCYAEYRVASETLVTAIHWLSSQQGWRMIGPYEVLTAWRDAFRANRIAGHDFVDAMRGNREMSASLTAAIDRSITAVEGHLANMERVEESLTRLLDEPELPGAGA